MKKKSVVRNEEKKNLLEDCLLFHRRYTLQIKHTRSLKNCVAVE